MKKITESKLRQLIRESLLAEAVITPEAALEKKITFTILKLTRDVEIFAKIGKRGVGYLRVQKKSGECANAWVVKNVEREEEVKGIGPLMYDLMIDFISPDPIISDRREVSDDAQKIWRFYLNNRPDIEFVQLKDEDATPSSSFTFGPNDCDQSFSKEWAETNGGKWSGPRNPFSKAYKRKDNKTPTLDALKRLGIVTIKIEG
jgi:hypothetical protein